VILLQMGFWVVRLDIFNAVSSLPHIWCPHFINRSCHSSCNFQCEYTQNDTQKPRIIFFLFQTIEVTQTFFLEKKTKKASNSGEVINPAIHLAVPFTSLKQTVQKCWAKTILLTQLGKFGVFFSQF
jgi:hypothetical protein